MKKTWIELSLFTEEQIATIKPNETMDGLILNLSEANSKANFSMYFSYQEASDLAIELLNFIDKNRRNNK